ncbi:dihydroxyacetone phosphate acyltransferase isoform X3 [Halyomorpha halys]|uniref:dihydroxyacetone phosphate acyltransferase isoform X3 n=1 Tax=Halyomorpha halys TaxID=286706 RepID=UPI0006D52690|nr:dihydroxyacetone phosphate acyltransferase isoform X3 [Halyomorpha halys]XP_014283657.1 dihydroxyacetone phosphate acyltransferase isoform X3 [Halyomorpha halys]
MAQKFRNILEDFQKNDNDFLWVSRAINFIKAYNQSRPHISPNKLKTIVAKSSQLYDLVKEVFEDKSLLASKQQIIDILEEIGYAYDLAVIRWLGLFLVKMLRKSLSGLYINESMLNVIVSEMGNSPVIFVPTHRSYCDFILMAFVCFKYNIHIPCVAAGMDFLSMKLMNNVLRNSKAFFMRRKFVDDHVYRSVFQEYIKAMISYEESPIEFFIEGTRSRTGKSLSPKFGFLAMVIEAYLSGDIPDLTIVPININYDRILEEGLFAYELLGIPKPKESTKGFFKALKVLDENYGNILVNFGDAFSIRSFLDNQIDFRYRCQENENNKIRQVAYKITEMQQSLQIYSCFNLLALVLYDHIIRKRSYALPLQEAIENVNELLFVFDLFCATVFIEGDLETSIKQSICIHSSLVYLSSENKIILKKPEFKRPLNQSENQKGCNLGEEIIEEGVPIVMLQIYVNPTLTLFIRSSIILTIFECLSKENEVTIDLLYENYQYLCDLFKHEFVLASSDFQYKRCLCLPSTSTILNLLLGECWEFIIYHYG